MLRQLRHTFPGAFLGGGVVPCPPLAYGTKQKSEKYTLKSRNQITIKHACGRGLRYRAF